MSHCVCVRPGGRAFPTHPTPKTKGPVPSGPTRPPGESLRVAPPKPARDIRLPPPPFPFNRESPPATIPRTLPQFTPPLPHASIAVRPFCHPRPPPAAVEPPLSPRPSAAVPRLGSIAAAVREHCARTVRVSCKSTDSDLLLEGRPAAVGRAPSCLRNSDCHPDSEPELSHTWRRLTRLLRAQFSAWTLGGAGTRMGQGF